MQETNNFRAQTALLIAFLDPITPSIECIDGVAPMINTVNLCRCIKEMFIIRRRTRALSSMQKARMHIRLKYAHIFARPCVFGSLSCTFIDDASGNCKGSLLHFRRRLIPAREEEHCCCCKPSTARSFEDKKCIYQEHRRRKIRTN